MTAKEEKAKFRTVAKAARAAVENREKKSRAIAKKLLTLPCFENCETLFAYYSYPQEVSTKAIISFAFGAKKRVALPRCEENGEMRFLFVENETDLERGAFEGVLEPKEGKAIARATKTSLAVIPALAFGKDGSRLGHGGGYYDRFLSNFDGTAVGLCFGDCLFETLPQDDFDRRVSLVVTENEIIYIK